MNDIRPGYVLIDDRWVPNHLAYMFEDTYEYCNNDTYIVKPSITYVIVDVIKSWNRKIITENNYTKNRSKYKLVEFVEEYIKRDGLAIGESGRSYMVWEAGNIR